jgi:hypothetical protein
MKRPRKQQAQLDPKDLQEARRIVSGVFPYGPVPDKWSPKGAPARWIFDLIPAIAGALAKRSADKAA